jgi:hypothetical protein
VVKHRDNLGAAHLAVCQLLRSRLITDQTRPSAVILKAQLEAELANEAASGDHSDISVIATKPKTLDKKAAS